MGARSQSPFARAAGRISTTPNRRPTENSNSVLSPRVAAGLTLVSLAALVIGCHDGSPGAASGAANAGMTTEECLVGVVFAGADFYCRR